ncbi:hypothetical protein Tco_1344981 [Tanacetum coccineum]
MDSQIISLNEEMQDMHEKYNELRNENASKNNINDDTPMCERHEANYIQSEGYQNQNSYDSYLHQSHYDPNDSEKSLTKLNNDVKNDLEYFKRCVRSMRTVHDKLYDRDDGKTTGVLPKKKSKPVNQEPQSKTDFEKLMTKFLDGQRKIDEWSKSQNVYLEQTERTDPPPPQAHTEHVNAIFTGSGKSDDSLKIQKDPPPSIIVNNETEKDKPIKTSKGSINKVNKIGIKSLVMSSASSAVTYTSVYTDSEPGRVFWGADEEISDGGVPRVIVLGYDGLPMQPVDPPSPDYVPGPEHPASPDYVPGPEHPPSPIEIPYVPEPEYPEYLVPSEDEAPMEDQPLPADASPVALSPGYVPDSDPEEDPEEDSEREPFEDEEDDEEEEEHLAPADSPVIPIVDPVPSAGDTEAFETDESAPTPRPPQIRIPFAQTRLRRARKTVRPEPPMSASIEARIA